MNYVFVFGVLASVSIVFNIVDAKGKVVCYLGSWAGYRQGDGAFPIDKIDPKLCTHLIYAFVGITPEGGIKVLDSWNDLPDGKNGFGKFNALRNSNPELKTMVAIGGWNEGSTAYSQVMSNSVTRSKFVNNAADFVVKYNFNGFDLDWEYPSQRGGMPSDKSNFALLLSEMRSKFDEYGLLLSAAVGAGRNTVDFSYDVPQLSRYLDFINVMTYDLHGQWEQVTGQNAPLYASSIDRTPQSQQLNVNASITYWISQGAQASKLILGIGTYGRTFTLASSSNRQLGAPASGSGPSGQYTREPGFFGYNEICEKLSQGGWTVTWDNEQKVPFASKGNEWVGYDNIESVKYKVDFARSLGLGGAMIWSLETDDFLGKCHGYKYPLLSAINEVFNGNGNDGGNGGITTKSTTTVRTTTTTTRKPPVNPGAVCQQEGYVRDPVDCKVFYYCWWVGNKFIQYRYACGDGLAFDSGLKVCNYQHLVAC